MNESQMRQIVDAVLAEISSPSSPAVSSPVPLEASARHVHLTEEAVARLFGAGEKLKSLRALSQPGEFLAEQRVKIVTSKGTLENVAVLGPARGAVQVEISSTDCWTLGIKAPIRLSGDLRGAADVVLIGPAGLLEAPGSTIVAQRHIHMTLADAAQFGLRQGQAVCLRAETARPVTFEDVIVRVSEKFALAAHIDFDEANACGFVPGNSVGRVVRCEGACTDAAIQNMPILSSDAKVVTERLAKAMRPPVVLRQGTILTPAAQDVFLHAKVTITYV